MDSSDVLCLSSSDSPRMMLVFKPFSGRGYGSWKREMGIAFTAKNKFGFVNGTCKKPEPDSLELQGKERSNNMVISLMLNGISAEISESVV